jgi:hypothetical protein
VTHNSLDANQRAHISLIDRRHLRPRRVPHRAISNDIHVLRQMWQDHSHAIDSVKPYQRHVERRALAARPLELDIGSPFCFGVILITAGRYLLVEPGHAPADYEYPTSSM